MKCGLLGRKLGHSYSPQIHGMLGSYAYSLFEKEPEEIEDFLKNGDFTGLNVTIPYKKAVIPYLDELSPQAKMLGAVNTIVRRKGKLIGHNTDYFGFQTMIAESGLKVFGKKVLVLGSGGASNTAVAVLNELGANVVVISRNGENNYGNLYLHKDAYAIVNTTPVGMYPNTGCSPVDLTQFPHVQGVLDVVYNPARTQLLLDASKKEITGINGLLMLVAQAKESAEWFTETTIPDETIRTIYNKMTGKMQNIVLVGMPGCGKSTVGKLVAQILGRVFVDADEKIIALAGKPIPEIFAEEGEPGFRDWETMALSELGKQSGLVIATGGGCVTKTRNYDLLHQNGSIIWLKRALDILPVDGRPLSAGADLAEMYRIRQPMYSSFSDIAIANDGSPEKTAAMIIARLEMDK